MNDTNSIYYDPLYKDNTKKYMAIALGFLLVVIAGVFYFVKKDIPVSSEVLPEGDTEEVEQILDALKASIQGYLLVDTYQLQSDGSYGSSTVTQISLNSNTYSEIIAQNNVMKYIVPNSPVSGTGVQYDTESGLFKAVSYNLDTQKFLFLAAPVGDYVRRVSSAKNKSAWYLADSFKKDVYGTEDWANLEYWQVTVGNVETEEVFAEQNASSPVWIEEGVDLAYIQSDGIYRHNVQTAVTEKIFGEYSNLSGLTELTVSRDSSYMVITMPSVGTMGILSRNSEDSFMYREVERIQKDSKSYTSPVFDPTGKFFAVVEKDINTQILRVVIYSTVTKERLEEVVLDDSYVDSAVLSAWSEFSIDFRNN